jgi:hypothetical protein
VGKREKVAVKEISIFIAFVFRCFWQMKLSKMQVFCSALPSQTGWK